MYWENLIFQNRKKGASSKALDIPLKMFKNGIFLIHSKFY